MTKLRIGILVVWCAGLSTSVHARQKGGQDETGPYEVVENWFKPIHEGFRLYVDDVLAETPDRVFVISYGESPLTTPADPRPGVTEEPEVTPDHLIVILDGDGNKIGEWTHAVPLMVHPHAAKISRYDPERHLWVVDREGHQIVKFSNDGRRVALTLGEKGVSGSDDGHFNLPADVAFLPDGSVLVADGYAGTRVAKFDRDGKFVTSWGSAGDGPGQFSLLHCVAVDAQGRVYVADRDNSRVQVFDSGGRYLDQWPIRRPNHLLITRDQFLWLSDGTTNRFAKYDLEGRLQTYWGVYGSFPGAFHNPHKFSVDSYGNLYVADYENNRVQKFRPGLRADPRRLIGAPF